MERYLLCIPRNGISDNFRLISKCLKYAKRYDRMLIIDSIKGGLKNEFSNYFCLKHDNAQIKLSLTNEQLSELNKVSCRPPEMAGHVDKIQLKGITQENKYVIVDGNRNCILSFDFSLDHSEELLIDAWYGEGIRDFDSLNEFKLIKLVQEHIANALQKLPKEYVALHIRNTDKKVDYRPFMSSIMKEIDLPDVLVCSDNAETIEDMRTILPGKNVHTVTVLPKVNGEPIHNHGTIQKYGLDQHSLNLNMLTDLFALSGATKLLFPRETVEIRSDGVVAKKMWMSGFSELALFIKNKPNLRSQLLGY